MRLSESDNVLIMAAKYSPSSYTQPLTHSVLHSAYPPVSRTICHMTYRTGSSVVESFISTWQPWDSWTGHCSRRPGLSPHSQCIAVGVWGLLTERIWWAGKDIHYTKALKSLFWVDANPLTFNNSSFWQQWASSGRVSGWACWARQSLAGICLSEQGTRLKAAEWLMPVKRAILTLLWKKEPEVNTLDGQISCGLRGNKWAISYSIFGTTFVSALNTLCTVVSTSQTVIDVVSNRWNSINNRRLCSFKFFYWWKHFYLSTHWTLNIRFAKKSYWERILCSLITDSKALQYLQCLIHL